jgi:hypothetical protein
MDGGIMTLLSMSPHRKKKSVVRGFERDLRIRELVGAQVIESPEQVPADAIPASLEVISRWRSSSSTFSRDPFYRDIHFTCEDCGRKSIWSAQDQRHWYEVLHGSPYSEARRCSECRKKRKGIAQQDGPANGSQPIRSKTNRTSPVAGSRR